MRYTGVLIKCPRCKHWGATVESKRVDSGHWAATCESPKCRYDWLSAAHERINKHVYGTKHRPFEV